VSPAVLRVAADVTPLLTPKTGIGVFVNGLLTHLGERDDLQLTGYAVTWRGRKRLAGAVPPGVAVAGDSIVPMAARPLHQAWMRLDHPLVDRWIGRQDVVWGTNYVVPPTRARGQLVSVYDLTPVRFPQLANEHTRTFPQLVQRALRRGAWVHTMSEYVRGEIVDHFGADPERVRVVGGGILPTPPGPGEPGQALAGGDRYVLALGTVEPRKDLPTLVAAFDALAPHDPDLRLVIAGADGWGAEALAGTIARAHHRERIVRLGWVGEEQRRALMRGAAVYAYPSIYEGFGLPPLEAMTAGVPVVATRTGSLPEVCGDGADLVPVGDADALAAALARVLADDAHRAELTRRGRAVAGRHTWPTAAEQFSALLHEVVAKGVREGTR
jgi:glycosyltransferase involved in cell wall biosynthesis